LRKKVTGSMQADNRTVLNTSGIPCECLSFFQKNVLATAQVNFASGFIIIGTSCFNWHTWSGFTLSHKNI